jgi:hypothetical protein
VRYYPENPGVNDCRAILLLVCCLPVMTSHATDFRAGDVEGLFDLTLAYGLGVRVEDTDERLVAIANGGKKKDANTDDGTLNYSEGIISNAVRLNADLTLAWKQFGVYARGFAMYDYENDHEDRARTPLSNNAKDIIGKDADFLDHYVSMRLSPGGIPVIFRLGDQVVNWGESAFIRDGVDIINPLNLATLGQPVVPARDRLIPQGMLWGAANITENVAIEGYYQYEWKRVAVPAVGSYFSNSDLFGDDGINFAMLGAGQFSDLGTNLDKAFALPSGTLGFDQDFFRLPGLHVDKPDDHGQFGLTLSAILPDTNATRIGLHLVRYHSRLPLINGRTASQEAIDQTSQAEVDALAESLVPAYESTGLTPEEAAEAASGTAGALTTSEYANQAGYRVVYPEDITMVGLSFSTATIKRGLLLSGEVSHHRNFPFQKSLGEVFSAVLSPIEFTGGGTGLGADNTVKGFIKLDRSQATLGVTQLFGSRFGASQTAASADVAWVHVHDMPGSNKLPLQGVNTPTASSWGYRLGGALTYNGVLGGLTLVPRVLLTHDVGGYTPAPVSTFVEGRKSFTAGLGLVYINRWTANLSYTSFFGAGSRNLVRDRDLVRFRVSYTF